MKRAMSLAALTLVVILAGLMAYVRFAPTDIAAWHIDLTPRPAALAIPSPNSVTRLRNASYVDLPCSPDQAHSTLAKIDAIAMATPRTRRLAGSLTEGHITWETRSLFWGFPDYTTAQITPLGLTLFAKPRFGNNDQGVNAARLKLWLSQL